MSCLNPEQVEGTFLAGPWRRPGWHSKGCKGQRVPLQLDATGTSLSPLVSSLMLHWAPWGWAGGVEGAGVSGAVPWAGS